MTDIKVVLAIPSQDSPANDSQGPLAYGEAWSRRITEELEARQIPYVVLRGDQVTRENVITNIEQYSPNLVYMFGHGFSNVILGDYSEQKDKYPSVFAIPGRVEKYGRVSLDNADELEDTSVYFLACNTGRTLLPEAVDQGAKATAGYNDEFIWMINSERRPENDERAEPFGEASTEFAVALAEGDTVRQAKERTIQKFNELIQKYKQRASLMDREYVKWLVWNRDHFKQFGNPDVQPIEKRKVVEQAVVPPELVAAGIGVSLLILSYKEYKRRK